MFLNNPNEEAILKAEAAERLASLGHSPEIERQQAMDRIQKSQQVDAEEEESFNAYHKTQQASRDFRRFLSSHPEYRNVGENTELMDTYIRNNFNNVVDLDTINAAFFALADAGKLKLSGEVRSENLDTLPIQELAHRQHEVESQAAQDEQADRRAFTKTGVKAGTRFLQQHPSFVACPQNSAVMLRWMEDHGVNLESPTLAQLNEAFNDLYFQGVLVIDESKKVTMVETEQSLYDMPLETLRDRANNGQKGSIEYEPSGLGARHFGVGTTYEAGEDQ